MIAVPAPQRGRASPSRPPAAGREPSSHLRVERRRDRERVGATVGIVDRAFSIPGLRVGDTSG